MQYERLQLAIEGHNKREMMATFYRQKTDTEQIAIVLPGLHYNSDMPLLYYSIGALLEGGHNVLDIKTGYADLKEFQSMQSADRLEWMRKDAEAIYRTIEELENCSVSVIIGKSLGTILMGHLLKIHEGAKRSKTCWLTPLLNHDWLLEQMLSQEGHSLIVIGTADPFYDNNAIRRLEGLDKCDVLIVTDADHSMNVPDGTVESIEHLKAIISRIRGLVKT